MYLATANEIEYALGLKDIRNPLVCGYLEMYEGTAGCEKVMLPVRLNSKFIIGPEGAHLNISGISGLAAKTSYAMFLMKAIQDRYLNSEDEEDSVAFVMFNVKGRDLLTIDQPNDYSDELQEKHAKGFVDKKEQSRMEATVEDARKKKDAAKKKLEKTVETLTTSSTLTPEQRVQKEIQYKFEKKNVSSATQKAEKKETEIVEQKEEKKSKYFTDNLSKLDKSKRKLVGQIMGIVSQIAPENIAEEIQAAIEKEFR